MIAWVRTGAALAIALTLALPSRAHADELRWAASVLGDVAVTPEFSGHGAVRFALDLDDVGGAHFGLLYDTETLRLAFDDIALAERLWLGFDAAGEYGYASLLPDYYRDGSFEPERGFAASYVGAGTNLTYSPNADHWFRARVGTRRWWFDDLPPTADALTLPDAFTAVEARFSYTFWRIENSREFDEKHRLFPRVEGFAIGGSVDVWWRSRHRPWGARDPAAFDPVDRRNDAEAVTWMPYGWLRAGTWVGDNVRWQVAHEAAFDVGGDDISRARIGGLNPYVIRMPGLPWGAFVAGRFLSAEWSWHVPFAARHEAGVSVAGAFVGDIHRTGDSVNNALFGASGFADLRFGAWQVDLRAGWSPTVPDRDPETQRNGFSALVGVGVGSR